MKDTSLDTALKTLKEQAIANRVRSLATKFNVNENLVLDLFEQEKDRARKHWGQFFPHLPHHLDDEEVLVNHFIWQIVAANLRAEKSEKDATLDSLTGLLNRGAFDKKVSFLSNSEGNFCLILFDIDNFKNINDTHGHPVGDIVIKSVARVLSSHTRPCDISARFGGEEFALIFEGSIENAKKLAERIRSDVESTDIERFFCNNLAIKSRPRTTVSAGISLFANNEDDPIQKMISEADEALYKAKNQGKNCVVIAGK